MLVPPGIAIPLLVIVERPVDDIPPFDIFTPMFLLLFVLVKMIIVAVNKHKNKVLLIFQIEFMSFQTKFLAIALFCHAYRGRRVKDFIITVLNP